MRQLVVERVPACLSVVALLAELAAASAPGIGAETQEAALAKADMATAKRMVVASWFPVDLANERLHRAMLDHGELRSVGEASQQEDIEGGVEGLRGLAVGDLLVDACREIAGAFQPRKAVACP